MARGRVFKATTARLRAAWISALMRFVVAMAFPFTTSP